VGIAGAKLGKYRDIFSQRKGGRGFDEIAATGNKLLYQVVYIAAKKNS